MTFVRMTFVRIEYMDVGQVAAVGMQWWHGAVSLQEDIRFIQRVVCSVLHRFMHESLDTRHTDLLIALRHTGHLARAAAQLSVSPSAASHRLKEAERRLGVALTATEGRSIRLTPAAIHLAEVAENVQSSMRSAEETARWMSSADRPTVRLALDFYDTAPWFERLLGTHEAASSLDAVRIPYDASVESVLRHRVDVAVIVVPGDERREHVLADDQLAAVVRDDHPAARRGALEPADIAETTYATAGDRPRHGFEHHEFFEPAGVRPYRLRKVESLAMVLRLIRAYGGITVQPRLALRDAPLTGLTVVPLHDARIDVRWQFVLRPEPGEAELEVCDAIRGVVDGLG